jgi:hypothetical protein
LELQGGEITLVKWMTHSARRQGDALRLERHLLAPPTELHALN